MIDAVNIDADEVGRFSALAHRWWDADGPGRTLHDINPLRLNYVRAHLPLTGSEILDVGCGGGILSEALAVAGARVTAIDASAEMVAIARLHLEMSGHTIDYRQATAESHAIDHAARYDAVTCMELLEHVPDPAALIDACARMLKPGGLFIVSTINRTPDAYLLAVIGAEYLLGLLPRGTHDYQRFIRPSELARCWRRAGLATIDLSGMAYNPLTRRARLQHSVRVNYLACARLEEPSRG